MNLVPGDLYRCKRTYDADRGRCSRDESPVSPTIKPGDVIMLLGSEEFVKISLHCYTLEILHRDRRFKIHFTTLHELQQTLEKI